MRLFFRIEGKVTYSDVVSTLSLLLTIIALVL